MRLYLVQHAQAKDKAEDPDRSLTQEGWDDIRKIAAFLAKHANIQLISIFHSGKKRAQETAEVLGSFLNPIAGIDSADGLSPLDDPMIWAQAVDGQNEDIMLVGHLPHIQRLCSQLLVGNSEEKVVSFHNAGVVCLERSPGDDWSLQWSITPMILPQDLI